MLAQGIADGLQIGAQLYVSQRGQILTDTAIGQASPGVMLTSDHLTLWLSAGTPLTAVAIAQQMEAGRLELDDSVAKHIPEFAQQGKSGITIRHLLMHTAGLRTARFNFPDDDWSTILRAICDARPEPRWLPGEKAGYHPHTSWYLLAEIIRRLTGERFSVAVRQHVMLPAEIEDSWIGMPSMMFYKYGDRIAQMPDTMVDETKRNDRPYHTMPWCVNCRPGGNAYGPARELGRLYEIFLNQGKTAKGCALLQPDTVKLFTSRHRQGMMDHTFKQTVDWGLGFTLNSYQYGREAVPYQFGPHAGEDTFGHGGSQSSIGFADPKHGLTVVVICLGRPGEAAHQQRMNALLRTLYWELGLG